MTGRYMNEKTVSLGGYVTPLDGSAGRVMAALHAHLPLTLLVDLFAADGPASEEIAAHERDVPDRDLSSGHARFGPAP